MSWVKSVRESRLSHCKTWVFRRPPDGRRFKHFAAFKRPDPHETWLSMALNRTAGKLRESIPWERETPPGRAKVPCDMNTPTLVSERNARAAFTINHPD